MFIAGAAGPMAGVGVGVVSGYSQCFFAQFCCEPKTAPKYEAYLKGNILKGDDDFFKNFEGRKDKERVWKCNRVKLAKETYN